MCEAGCGIRLIYGCELLHRASGSKVLEARTHKIEPFLFQLVHDDLKNLIRDGSRLLFLPLCIDDVEPFLVCTFSSGTAQFIQDSPCSSMSYSTCVASSDSIGSAASQLGSL